MKVVISSGISLLAAEIESSKDGVSNREKFEIKCSDL